MAVRALFSLRDVIVYVEYISVADSLVGKFGRFYPLRLRDVRKATREICCKPKAD